MLELEIINSPDKLQIGSTTFFSNEITIGKSKKCELTINDELIHQHHIKLSIVEKKLFITAIIGYESSPISSNDNVEMNEPIHFLINKKKYSGKKMININDVIKLGNTEIITKAFAEEKYLDFKEELTKNYKKIHDDNHYAHNVLDALEKELLHLQIEANKKLLKDKKSCQN